MLGEICRAGLVGAPCTTSTDCDVLPGDGLCLPEECDPPSSETCNNQIDDDGDLLIDCADPECQTVGLTTCGETCELVPPCGRIRRDPAQIKFDDLPKLDFFKLHGRVPIDPLSIVVEDIGFAVILSNINGTIYEATVTPAQLVDKAPKQRWKYKNNEAKDGLDPPGPQQGLARVRMKVRQIDGVDFLTFGIKAYSDFSAATDAQMSSQVYMAGEVSILSAIPDERNTHWRLRLKDFPPCDALVQHSRRGDPLDEPVKTHRDDRGRAGRRQSGAKGRQGSRSVQQRYHGGDDRHLAELDADVEGEQRRQHTGALPHSQLHQHAGEAEAVNQAEREGQRDRLRRPNPGSEIACRHVYDRRRDGRLDDGRWKIRETEHRRRQGQRVSDGECRDQAHDDGRRARGQQQREQEQKVIVARDDVLDAENHHRADSGRHGPRDAHARDDERGGVGAQQT